MVKDIIFYNKNEKDKNVNLLIIKSLEQIKLYYDIKNSNSDAKSLSYEKNSEINLMDVFICSLDIHISEFINKFDELLNKDVNNIVIDESKCNILKYFVDFCWFNMIKKTNDFNDSTYFYFNNKFEFKQNNIMIRLV